MDQVQEALTAGDIGRLIKACQEAELDLCWNALVILDQPAYTITEPNIYVLLQLAHLIENNIPLARFVAKRAPQEAQTPELNAVTNIGIKLFEDNVPGAYQAIKSFEWSQPVAPLVDRLRIALQERMFALLEMAYDSISIKDTTALLGLGSAEETIELAQQGGWTVASTGGWLYPPPEKRLSYQGPKPGQYDNSQRPGLSYLDNLSNIVLNLERS
ncbi:COP9 signalosome [Phlyctochytrium arcticum]|nr:COP9 signalosome [Phlyctochytrium arcticum]